ncbi:hypothetical protein Plim_2375 [Planctopirus limnophila DSM 3776]|uniref:Uncharacterized protein n=1 Tax=Planctopirus limnophila (strain ATCC 43296 / DSM 3776 / IFAM 1008 / Mu 290) TaxID=521674 RepID=D5SP57_PLAL2|nr:hypothetical protein Plim_2375 [Planctopirus limnophila DSM 3776]
MSSIHEAESFSLKVVIGQESHDLILLRTWGTGARLRQRKRAKVALQLNLSESNRDW